MDIKKFQKLFETTEKEAKQSTLYETRIQIGSNRRSADYETSRISVGTFRGGSKIKYGAHDVLTWIETPGEEKHRLRHKHSKPETPMYVELCVKPKQDRWLASIEINPEAADYNEIKRSLEDNDWEEKPIRGRRTKKPV